MTWNDEYMECRKRFIGEGFCEYDAAKKAYNEMRRKRNKKLEEEKNER